MKNAENSVVITRDFTASIDAVWDMWTDPAKFSQWYGPNGMTVPVAEMDVTIGGIRKICMEMKMPERTMTMWFTGTYKEIAAPNRLVYSESMCDADGNLISPASMGMPEGTPEVTEVIVELQEVDGQTRMTMTHVGVPAGSPGEGGWNQAFDKLAALFN
ncbi:SRPBCC domain-containing protein [Loktanella sp. D2R18]|uniref:SRPBCC family protein n=1 Tax=Rhodobacterales TaxID=204455 RepID=UPI000DE824B3|nr:MULTISPECIES: SRPBCC domain-containing protein [Rhodobacterales]MDO6589382.1 SRPBCC domain-containing protein [Yoonia sp. 1_MG-2023]RBW45208.1 SRPBCC domain-containing protein [Loktanella sp. D2R18]